MLSNVYHIISLKEVPKHRIIKEQNKAINPNRHIHLGSSIRIPKYFKLSKYFSKLKNG